MQISFNTRWAQDKREVTLFTTKEPETQRQFFYREYWHVIEDIVKNLPKSARILEIGCGRGTLSQYLRHAGYENVTLLDESDEALALARHNLGYSAKLVKGDALKLPFQEGAFDFVFSMGVSEHIDNYPTFFYEQLRILKKDGWLLCFTVPKKLSVQMLNIFGKDRFYRSRSTVGQYALLLNQLTDCFVAEAWCNPYPLFTPVPMWFDRVVTRLYRGIQTLRVFFTKTPFLGSELLCQTHILVTRRSS